MQTVIVKHNMEMAHRLFETEGKCENIHGHSWNVTLELGGNVDPQGLLEGLDFSLIKSTFRGYLDSTYDHRVLLNSLDPFADTVTYDGETELYLPGLQRVGPEDPTTENIARYVGEWARGTFPMCQTWHVTVWETAVNCATWRL